MNKKIYKNFAITIFWRIDECGHRFRIYDANGTLVFEGSDTYFYIHNAIGAAKKIIDEMEVSA